MKYGQPPAVDIELVEGMCPKLAPHLLNDRGFVLLAEPRNDVLKEARDGMRRRVDGSTVMSGLDDRFTRAVELRDGIVVVLHRGSRYSPDATDRFVVWHRSARAACILCQDISANRH
jgi:hypothetical protein